MFYKIEYLDIHCKNSVFMFNRKCLISKENLKYIFEFKEGKPCDLPIVMGACHGVAI